MPVDIAAVRGKRNQAVAFTRSLIDKANERLLRSELLESQGYTPEEREQYERADKEIEAFGELIEAEERQLIREQWGRQSQGVSVRNDPENTSENLTEEEWRALQFGVRAGAKNDSSEKRYMSGEDYTAIASFVLHNRSTLRENRELPLPSQFRTRWKNQAFFPDRRSGTVEYEEEFHRYLLGGGMGSEMRALQADSDVAGGFSVPSQQFANQLIQAVHDQVFVYGLATKYTVTRAESLGAPALSAQMSNAQWGTELSVNVGGADTALQFSKRELRPHPLVNEILVSKKLIRTSAIDVEALVRDQLSYHFAIPLEQAFLQGSGANQPLGVFTNFGDNLTGVTTGRDFISGASSGVITSTGADDLVEVKFALKGNYWPRAVWIFNRLHFKHVRQLKDANNQYLWSPGGFGVGVSNGQPDRLLDFPIYMSEYAPTSTASGSTSKTLAQDGSTGALSGYVAICGDFSKYWIATALDMTVQVLTELKAETNQNAYLGRMEVDGVPVLAEAFSRFKLKGY